MPGSESIRPQAGFRKRAGALQKRQEAYIPASHSRPRPAPCRPGTALPLEPQRGLLWLQPPSCAPHPALSMETSHVRIPPCFFYSVRSSSLYFLFRLASHPLAAAFIPILSSSEPPLAPALPNPTLKGQPLGIHPPPFSAAKLPWERRRQPCRLEFLQLHGLQPRLGPWGGLASFPCAPSWPGPDAKLLP